MTTSEIEKDILYLISNGYYAALTSIPSIETIKNIISQQLEQISEAKTLDLVCSSNMKLLLMNYFWIDDFNYLGTKIKIIEEKNFNQEISIIPGSSWKRYKILLYCDNKPIAFAETIL